MSASELRDILASNNAHMKRQEEQIMVAGLTVLALVAQVAELSAQFQQLKTKTVNLPTSPNPPSVSPTGDLPAHHSEPRLPPPAASSGEPHLCHPFLAKCSLFSALQPSAFPSEESKVALVITLLAGRAGQWVTGVCERKHQCCSSLGGTQEGF